MNQERVKVLREAYRLLASAVRLAAIVVLLIAVIGERRRNEYEKATFDAVLLFGFVVWDKVDSRREG